jgi:predicted ferric reductase
MENKTLGWGILLILSLAPIFLLFYFGPNINLSDYAELTHKLGQLAALIGMTMFALTFILSMRIKFIEDLFGGLDKVYVAHGMLGGTALILLVFHPILLVLKFVPSNMKLAASYILPSNYWSTNLGIMALLGLILLIFITLYTSIKYHKWKVSHKFLGLVFILAVLHIFLVRNSGARDYIFTGYYIYATIVSLIGILGLSYTLFLKKAIVREAIYIIRSINKEKEAYEFTLIPEKNPIAYKSGQFIFVRFYNENLSKEQHPFSIASKSNDNKIKIFVKNLGDFTSNMHHVKVGDKVAIEGPYGRFNNKTNSDQIWIAGGIGITPFIGMVEDLKEKKTNNKVDLFYSVKTKEDFVSLDNIKEVEKINPHFHVFPWITSEKGHLTLKGIIENSELDRKDFYICGPQGFKNSIKDSLIESGVSENKIHMEDFSFK